jgi:hypothetical protein
MPWWDRRFRLSTRTNVRNPNGAGGATVAFSENAFAFQGMRWNRLSNGFNATARTASPRRFSSETQNNMNSGRSYFRRLSTRLSRRLSNGFSPADVLSVGSFTNTLSYSGETAAWKGALPAILF